eukprot:CAMPEP_0185017576 /NCGR_PEP_ID=MMETSP1103-20130426/511_1 /TAXON_ID=36769 /ORGANISM="Paraphysomonas bandaiensis, Strain Caron Lab Isolate" /LENGTH=278 /DNA_ID=CAMNT_0027547047 /DNA_START=138 /DNA_END=974 /DNA_ORIENTATION=+
MKGKVVVISGASSGIGEELGKLFSSKGANVVLSARRAEKLHDVARQCIDIGAERAEVISCDVSKEGDCKQLIAKTVDIFGQIDMLILNAGVGQSFFLEAMSPDVNIHQYMDVNYYGAVFPTISALPYLHSTNGRIVVVSSLGGLMPFPRQTLYNASKYALLGFFESLRMELLSKGSEVSVTIVCPGFVKTEITSGGGLGRDGKPIGKAASQKSLPGVKMISAKECAEDIAKAAESRTPLRVTPYWYTPILLMRKLFPNLVDKILVKIFSPSKNKKSTV